MAYKCKVCGYRFKPDDTDLCPECFTPRDDVGCEAFEAHSHECDSLDDDSGSFIEQQLREERNSYATKAENKAEKEYRAEQANRKKKYQTVYRTASYFRNSNLNAGNNYRSSTYSNGTYQNYSNYQNSQTAGKAQISEKTAKRIKKIFITIVILCVLSNFVLKVLFAVISAFYDDDEDDYDYEYTNDDYSYSDTTDIWVTDDFTAQSDDGSITATINSVYIASEGCTAEDFESGDSYVFNSYVEDVTKLSWEKITAEITAESTDEDIVVCGAGMCAYDTNDTLIYSTYTSFDDTDSRQSTSSKWVNFPITDSAPRIRITVYSYTGSETEYVEIKSAYSQIINNAQ